MSKIITVYCEGKKGSHDYDILEKVTDGLVVNIQPIGSKKGAGSAIQVYESLAVKSDDYIFFRDRDFDKPMPEDGIKLIKDKYICFGYFTTIENYLFDYNLLLNFIVEKKLALKYGLNSIEDVKKIFIKAAKKIAYYQAIRHSMGKMRFPTDFGTTWIEKGSGTLPTIQELENNNLCREKALEKLQTAKIKTDLWTESEFDKTLNSYYTQFCEPSFYENGEYLAWFQGKDFAKAIGLFLNEFPMNDYYKFSKKHFDYKKFADLVELRKEIESLL